eukprot:6313288-Pyramimonas_sp.AAC.1
MNLSRTSRAKRLSCAVDCFLLGARIQRVFEVKCASSRAQVSRCLERDAWFHAPRLPRQMSSMRIC